MAEMLENNSESQHVGVSRVLKINLINNNMVT